MGENLPKDLTTKSWFPVVSIVLYWKINHSFSRLCLFDGTYPAFLFCLTVSSIWLVVSPFFFYLPGCLCLWDRLFLFYLVCTLSSPLGCLYTYLAGCRSYLTGSYDLGCCLSYLTGSFLLDLVAIVSVTYLGYCLSYLTGSFKGLAASLCFIYKLLSLLSDRLFLLGLTASLLSLLSGWVYLLHNHRRKLLFLSPLYGC